MARMTKLVEAIAAGDVEDALARIANPRTNIHAREEDALRLACDLGHIKVVEALLAHGADPHANGSAALERAVVRGHNLILRKLLEHCPGNNPPPDMLLCRAATSRNCGAVSLLAEAGCDMASGGRDAIPAAAAYASAEMLNTLLKLCGAESADLNYSLREAVIHGNEETCKALLSAGADPNANHGAAFGCARNYHRKEILAILKGDRQRKLTAAAGEQLAQIEASLVASNEIPTAGSWY